MAKTAAATKKAEAVMAEAETIRREGFKTIQHYKNELAKLMTKRKAVALKSLEEAVEQVPSRVRPLSDGLRDIHMDLPCGLQN